LKNKNIIHWFRENYGWFLGVGILVLVGWAFYYAVNVKEPEPTYQDLFPEDIRSGRVLEINAIDPIGVYYAVRVDTQYNLSGPLYPFIRDVLAPGSMAKNLKLGDIVYFYFANSKRPYPLDDLVLVPKELAEKMISGGVKFLPPFPPKK